MIRAYINRGRRQHAPLVVETWVDGGRVNRTYCEDVTFKGTVRLRSAKPGFMGDTGPVHFWVESDANSVAAIEGVTHTEGPAVAEP